MYFIAEGTVSAYALVIQFAATADKPAASSSTLDGLLVTLTINFFAAFAALFANF